MGEPDLYPFILTPNVIEKLGFIHELVHQSEAVGTGADVSSDRQRQRNQ
jgi:hypothetical protein